MMGIREILTLFGTFGSACSIFGAIDILAKWREQLLRNSQFELPEESRYQEQEISTSEVIDDAKSQTQQRLNKLLELLNQTRNSYNKITISELAEFCGYKKTSVFERYFLGTEEPEQEEKESICSHLGVNPKWLKHGKEEPFCSQEPHRYLAEGYFEFIKSKSPEKIIFVRSRDKKGSACIVLQLNNFKYVVLPTSWNISGIVGSGGRNQIYSLYKLVKKLQDWEIPKWELRNTALIGVHLDEQDYLDLIRGKIYPGFVDTVNNDYWWDDLTDINHIGACAPSYEEYYGKNFIEAQENIRYLLGSSTS